MRNDFKIAVATVICLVIGGILVRSAETQGAPHFKILTYNVNWGEPGPELAAEIIRDSDADIVCLQETTSQWEQFLRRALATNYPFMQFQKSTTRTGGGFAFLSKVRAREVAHVLSDTGWFDGWIMRFETTPGPVQVLNVHLHPPVSDSGSWVSGYFSTRDDRVREIERFYAARQPGLPLLVAGDFNDTETSAAVRWLEGKGMTNALPQFDRYGATWQWHTSLGTIRRRMDHILYSSGLECSSAKVLRAGASDHFPIEAVFTKQGTTHERKKENLEGETGRQQRVSAGLSD